MNESELKAAIESKKVMFDLDFCNSGALEKLGLISLDVLDLLKGANGCIVDGKRWIIACRYEGRSYTVHAEIDDEYAIVIGVEKS